MVLTSAAIGNKTFLFNMQVTPVRFREFSTVMKMDDDICLFVAIALFLGLLLKAGLSWTTRRGAQHTEIQLKGQ
jgi:hypothetical protein